MKYCSRCVYPEIAVNLNFNNAGVCSSCLTFEKMEEYDDKFWKAREVKFLQLVEKIKSDNKDNDYDCIIPVSGGKDSYFQTYMVTKKYGLKALLVTYHGNNFLPEGDHNRDNMRHVFNVDHLVYGPSVDVLKKLNRLGFKKMGDMNWQNHCGIFTAPIRIATKLKIPYLIWGEIVWDISGMFDPEDFVEFSARVRHEHGLRGFEWNDFLSDQEDKLDEKDLIWAKYPSDEEIIESGVRGIYLGNYFKWDPNKHSKMMLENYNWKPASKPFQRTYRMFSNIDDKYENGVHDLMKYVKFGYGRASDHASKDIRTGYMKRDEGIEMVKKYDHVVSDDLYEWLSYVNMSESHFWQIADTFRDPRVWNIDEENYWVKDTLWEKNVRFEKVRLDKSGRESFIKRKKNLKFI